MGFEISFLLRKKYFENMATSKPILQNHCFTSSLSTIPKAQTKDTAGKDKLSSPHNCNLQLQNTP